MTQRERFEAWRLKRFGCAMWEGTALGDDFDQCWQASRVAALEEFCTMLWDVRKMTGCISSDAVGEIQDAIRALAKSEGENNG